MGECHKAISDSIKLNRQSIFDAVESEFVDFEERCKQLNQFQKVNLFSTSFPQIERKWKKLVQLQAQSDFANSNIDSIQKKCLENIKMILQNTEKDLNKELTTNINDFDQKKIIIELNGLQKFEWIDSYLKLEEEKNETMITTRFIIDRIGLILVENVRLLSTKLHKFEISIEDSSPLIEAFKFAKRINVHLEILSQFYSNLNNNCEEDGRKAIDYFNASLNKELKRLICGDLCISNDFHMIKMEMIFLENCLHHYDNNWSKDFKITCNLAKESLAQHTKEKLERTKNIFEECFNSLKTLNSQSDIELNVKKMYDLMKELNSVGQYMIELVVILFKLCVFY